MGLLEIDNYNKLKMNKKLAGFYHKKLFSDYELTARFYERGIVFQKKYKKKKDLVYNSHCFVICFIFYF